MRLNKTTEYAIRVLLHLAQHGDTPCSTNTLHQQLDIPYKYLGRLMKNLTDAGFLNSTRGKAGGYRLARDKAKISLHQVIEAVEGVDDFQHCILGLPECSDSDPCVMHERWGKERERIRKMFANVSLKDLARKKDLRS
jgi:Rrf2 family protein